MRTETVRTLSGRVLHGYSLLFTELGSSTGLECLCEPTIIYAHMRNLPVYFYTLRVGTDVIRISQVLDTVVVRTASGIEMRVAFGDVNQRCFMNVELCLAPRLRNSTMGLLGNADGDSRNDRRGRDGALYGETQPEIDAFAETCKFFYVLRFVCVLVCFCSFRQYHTVVISVYFSRRMVASCILV